MHVRRVDPVRDLDAVQRLFDELFQRASAREVWVWKYSTPWSTRPCTWAGFDERGDLVAHLGAVPLRGQVRGKETTFFQLGDIVVHPRMRAQYDFLTLGPGIILKEIVEEHPGCLFYGFTGRRTAFWYRRQGGHVIEEACDRIVRVAESSAALGDARSLRLEPLDWQDPAIDDIWSRLGAPTGVIKDRTWLDWRYKRYPMYAHRLLGVEYEGSLAGWLVLAAPDYAPRLRAEIRALDHLLPDELLPAALGALARATEASAAVCWHPSGRWKGESRPTQWMAVCLSRAPEVSSEEAARNFSYALGEADEWWW